MYSDKLPIAKYATPLQEWERYPSNLAGFDHLLEDAEAYWNRLEDLGSVLFSEKIEIDVIDTSFSGADPPFRMRKAWFWD